MLLSSLLGKITLSELNGVPSNWELASWLICVMKVSAEAHEDIGRKSPTTRVETFSGAATCQGAEASCNTARADLQDTAENPH